MKGGLLTVLTLMATFVATLFTCHRLPVMGEGPVDAAPFIAPPVRFGVAADCVTRPVLSREPRIPGLGLNVPKTVFLDEIERLETHGLPSSDLEPEILALFPRLTGRAIVEIGPGTGDLAHAFARLVGPEGVVYMVEVDPAAIDFLAYRFSREDAQWHDRERLALLQDTLDSFCLPRQKARLIFARSLHMFVTDRPAGMTEAQYDVMCARLWGEVRESLDGDEARLVIIDHYKGHDGVPHDYTPEEAVARIESGNLHLVQLLHGVPSPQRWTAVFKR